MYNNNIYFDQHSGEIFKNISRRDLGREGNGKIMMIFYREQKGVKEVREKEVEFIKDKLRVIKKEESTL